MENKQHHSGGLSSGFLLGVIVGVIVTLLLTTKRGKKILKLITEEGMHKLSDWEEVFADAVEEYERKPQEPKPKPITFLEEPQEPEEREEKVVKEEVRVEKPVKVKHEEPKSSSKRFFRGIHRRSVN